MFKNILLGFMSLCLICTSINAYAGIVSKAVKGAIVYQGGKALVKNIAKKQLERKIIKDGVKDSTKALKEKELNVGEYGKMVSKNKEEGLDQHHMPSAKQMKKYGVNKNDGVSMGVESDRHSLTRTYKGRNKEHLNANESPREALARDIKDAKKIYEDNLHYNKNTRESLQEVIKQNKEKFPHLFKKQ